MTSLLDLARSRVGELKHRLFEAQRHHMTKGDGVIVLLSFSAGSKRGPVTRVTGAGPTIEAAIDAAVRKMERQKEQGRAA